MYDMYSLENDLAMDSFIDYNSSPQLDNNKVLGALKFLTEKLKEMECQSLANQTESLGVANQAYSLENELAECKTIIRKMGKDYPELVLSYPKFFTKEEKNAHNGL